MTVQEIKSKYSMRDILNRYNIEVDRNGFCKCVFHNGDNTPSMKVYVTSFYCFGCGAGGDIIKFVQLHDNLLFQEACKWISGEELTQQSRYQLAVARVKAKDAIKREYKLREELDRINVLLATKWQQFSNAEPFSDDWCNSYNKWQLLCYKQEIILKELGAK